MFRWDFAAPAASSSIDCNLWVDVYDALMPHESTTTLCGVVLLEALAVVFRRPPCDVAQPDKVVRLMVSSIRGNETCSKHVMNKII